MTLSAASDLRHFGEKPSGRRIGRHRLDLWPVFQRWSTFLIYLGVAGTATYLAILVLPRMFGGELSGSVVIPGWQGVNDTILYIHIVTAIPPLLLGLAAFSATLRRASARSHRWIGTIYCVGIWVSAISGFLLATANDHGLFARLGFATLAIVWFVTTYMAYIKARRKQFPSHRQWIIRSYAITLAVVSVRPMFMIEPPFGLDYDSWYQIVTWLCWMPNLLIAECYLRITHYNGALKPTPQTSRTPLPAI